LFKLQLLPCSELAQFPQNLFRAFCATHAITAAYPLFQDGTAHEYSIPFALIGQRRDLMQPLVKFNRVLPYVFPEVFPVQNAAAAATELSRSDRPVAVMDEQAKRLKQLYHRSLRNQRNGESLTYSGALSA
jgi:hypothetical protein